MDDLISRQAAIDALDALCDRECEYSKQQRSFMCGACRLGSAFDVIDELPSAQPEPKEGHWILRKSPDGGEQYECSECGVLWEFIDGTPEDNEAYFCPKCGAKMDEEKESEHD